MRAGRAEALLRPRTHPRLKLAESSRSRRAALTARVRARCTDHSANRGSEPERPKSAAATFGGCSVFQLRELLLLQPLSGGRQSGHRLSFCNAAINVLTSELGRMISRAGPALP